MKELSDRELYAVIIDLLKSAASRLAVAKNGWSRRTYPVQATLQDLWDSQERANFLFLSANSKKKPDEPNTYPRGWDKPKEKKPSGRKVMQMTPEQAAKFYTGLVKKRDASITNEEIKQRNIEYLRREEKQNGSSGTQK